MNWRDLTYIELNDVGMMKLEFRITVEKFAFGDSNVATRMGKGCWYDVIVDLTWFQLRTKTGETLAYKLAIPDQVYPGP